MPLEYHAIRKSFDSVAHQYEDNAILQKEVLSRLLERVADEQQLDNQFKPQQILDLGCGTGWAIPELLVQFEPSQIHALDFSAGMLDQIQPNNRVKTLLNDAHDLPFDDNSLDLVFSNMLIHWCNEKDVFKECMRVLKPDGILIMSALGETSLVELKQAWLSVDKKPHVHDFPALHDMGDGLLNLGFKEVVVNAEIITLTYVDCRSLMKDIKASGGHNVMEGRKKGLMSRSRLNTLEQSYDDFRENGKIPASYEVVYLRAKKAKSSHAINLTIKDG